MLRRTQLYVCILLLNFERNLQDIINNETNINEIKKRKKTNITENIKKLKNITKKYQKNNNLKNYIKFASFNSNSISGKIHLIENFIKCEDIDFIYICEAGIAPGSRPISPNIVFQIGHERKLPTGRYPYGHILMFNNEKASEDNFIPILCSDQFLLAFQYKNQKFCGVYIRPNDNDALTVTLDKMSTLLLEHKDMIFFGDFNARHKSFGDHSSNSYGPTLIQWLKDNGLKRIQCFGNQWTFLRGTTCSIPDHILSPIDIQAYVEHNTFLGNADHRPLVGSFFCSEPHNIHKTNIFRGWNRFNLKKEEIIKNIIEFLSSQEVEICEKIDSIINRNILQQDKAEEINNLITSTYISILKKYIGRTSKKKRQQNSFLTEELLTLERNCEYYYHAWKNSSKSSDTIRNHLWEKLSESKKILLKNIKLRKKEIFREFSDYTDKCNPTEMIKIVNSMSKARQRRNPEGLSPSNLEEYRNHFQSIYDNPLPQTRTNQWENLVQHQASSNLEVSMSDVYLAIRMSANGKAAGIDEVPNEIFKVTESSSSKILCKAFNFFISQNVIPSTWKTSIIKPIHKKEDFKDIKNYRPISLSVSCRRLFEKVLLPRLTGYIEPLQKAQNGFRSRRGCIDAVASLQEDIIQNSNIQKVKKMIFLDIKAAYDC